MNILGIDTSTAYASVGLSVNGKVTAETWKSQHNHGLETMTAATRLLDRSNLVATDIDAIAVAQGPGGFSAVRVGIATAQGLTAPTGAKLIAVPTHLIQAYPHRDSNCDRVVSLIPIGRKQLSFAVYNTPFKACDAELESGICSSDDQGEQYGGTDTIFCGEGSLDHNDDESRVDMGDFRAPESLLEIAVERLDRDWVASRFIEPIYSRPPTITAPRRT